MTISGLLHVPSVKPQPSQTKVWSVPSGVRQLWLEPDQPAGAGAVGADPHQRRHLGHEGALALRGHVLLLLLLAHRGPLELLHQLPALVSSHVRAPTCTLVWLPSNILYRCPLSECHFDILSGLSIESTPTPTKVNTFVLCTKSTCQSLSTNSALTGKQFKSYGVKLIP